MTTTITLPDYLARQLQQRAEDEQRSVEALALTYIKTGLARPAPPPVAASDAELANDPELLALVARIKASPPPARVIPSQAKLAAVLRAFETMDLGDDYDLAAEIAALDAAEAELRAINRADDIAEGRG
jgi:plasmid stability protein